jgi:hypothetical protein
MLSTVAISAVGKAKIGDRIENIQEKIDTIKENTNNFVENLNKLKTNNDSSFRYSYESLGTTLRTLKELKTASSSFNFYTNYNGIEKTTKLKFFSATDIDVDGDSDKDISAKLSLRPGITTPFALSINFGLTIKRLNGFNDVNALFKAYAEIVFPGTVKSDIKGDKIFFGYQSPDGERVPDSCVIT